MELTEIQNRIHLVILELRRIQDVVKHPKFTVAFEGADEATQKEAWDIINKRDANGLRHWLDDQMENCLALLSVRELRVIAIKYGISVAGMDKGQLLHYIEAAKKNVRQDETAAP